MRNILLKFIVISITIVFYMVDPPSYGSPLQYKHAINHEATLRPLAFADRGLLALKLDEEKFGAAGIRGAAHGTYKGMRQQMFDFYSDIRAATGHLQIFVADPTPEQEPIMATMITVPHITLKLAGLKEYVLNEDGTYALDDRQMRIKQAGVFNEVSLNIEPVKESSIQNILMQMSEEISKIYSTMWNHILAKAKRTPEQGGYKNNAEALKDLNALYAILVTYDNEIIRVDINKLRSKTGIGLTTEKTAQEKQFDGLTLGKLMYGDLTFDPFARAIEVLEDVIAWTEKHPGVREPRDLAQTLIDYCDTRVDSSELQGKLGVMSLFNVRRIAPLINNIVTNCCDFAVTRATIDLEYDRSAGMVTITISDDGPDISEELMRDGDVPGRPAIYDLDRTDRKILAERIAREKAEGVTGEKASREGITKGTGLGMWASWHIARQLGGSIKIVPRGNNKGKSFVVTFPVSFTATTEKTTELLQTERLSMILGDIVDEREPFYKYGEKSAVRIFISGIIRLFSHFETPAGKPLYIENILTDLFFGRIGKDQALELICIVCKEHPRAILINTGKTASPESIRNSAERLLQLFPDNVFDRLVLYPMTDDAFIRGVATDEYFIGKAIGLAEDHDSLKRAMLLCDSEINEASYNTNTHVAIVMNMTDSIAVNMSLDEHERRFLALYAFSCLHGYNNGLTYLAKAEELVKLATTTLDTATSGDQLAAGSI